MLHNKSTGKTDVFSMEGLVTWLEQQPATKKYDYSNIGAPCLQSQYFTAMGKPARALGNTRVLFEGEHGGHHIPHAFHVVAHSTPWTFGAALARAKTFLK